MAPMGSNQSLIENSSNKGQVSFRYVQVVFPGPVWGHWKQKDWRQIFK